MVVGYTAIGSADTFCKYLILTSVLAISQKTKEYFESRFSLFTIGRKPLKINT